MRSAPAVTDVLTEAEVAATVEAIVATQLPSGLVPLYPDGPADPWNHVESAMALTIGGRWAEAARAYRWLADHQRPDGAWCRSYRDGRVDDAGLDANFSAYVATGTWHHFLVTSDVGFLEAMWPVVDAAVGFVLDLQTPRGEVRWARGADGSPWPHALLAGSSSVCHSLRAALAVATRLGRSRPGWELAAAALARAVTWVPGAFAPRDRWAMDWYYPVLAGVVTGTAGRARLAGGRDRFVIEGRGTRCVSDRPWVTAAETCECALAHLAAGEEGRARDLFGWAQGLRAPDGAYHTGVVLPEGVLFPAGSERPTAPPRWCWPPTPSPVPPPPGSSPTPPSSPAHLAWAHRRGPPGSGRSRPGEVGGDRLPDRGAPGGVSARGGRSADDLQRAGRVPLLEAVLEGLPVDLVGRPAPLGGVGEDVVDGQQAPRCHPRRPGVVVGMGRGGTVAAVDEHQRAGGRPVRSHGDRVPTTATTVPSSPADQMAWRNVGRVSRPAVTGSRRDGSWWGQPGWFSSEPRWWSTAKTTDSWRRAAAPR